MSYDAMCYESNSIDVDECQTSNGGCAEFCNNTGGSFECSCRTGYMLTADDASCEGKIIIIIIIMTHYKISLYV